MILSLHVLAWMSYLAGLTAASPKPPHGDSKPKNIIMIMTDDQDRLLGSTDFQSSLKREFFDKGVEVTNHYVTVAQCCPSRTAFLRGQHAHNTNVTHVIAPG
jgi:N-acetylglucosamine-6-sulfatase